jgi:two-component system, sensor histidine kinase and response regulator
MAKPKILTVDDRAQNLYVLERLLSPLDVDVIKAASGMEALGLVLEHDFCVAIVDVQMPEMDGYELVELMRGNERASSLPVIFVSAIYSDEYHHRKGYSAGAVDFMSKPFNPDILLSKVKVFIDLYKQRQNLQSLIEKLDGAYLQLEIVNRELEQFAQLVATELRAPVRAIEGYARILTEDYVDSLPADGGECLRNVQNSARKMDHMIQELLDFAHLGIMPVQLRKISLADLAKAVLDRLLRNEPERLIRSTVADLPPVVVDPVMFEQVFTDLLSNAIKFSCERKETQIDVGFNRQNGKIVYFVRDNGIGFDMQNADKLFDIFQRLHPAEQYPGVGLGLARARQIINRHGGQIWAEAEPGKGAIFYFTLPEAGESSPAKENAAAGN